MNKIADKLGFNVSTISREIKRNTDSLGKYRSSYADKKTKTRVRTRRLGKSKILSNPKLKAYIDSKIISKWSPYQIATTLKNSVDSDMSTNMSTLSHESIYQYIYVLPRGELKKELIAGLRYGHKYRRGQRKKLVDEEKRGKIANMISIHERPKEVEDRTVPGHWESDLIIGKYKASAIATLVERTTRFTIIVQLPNGKDCIAVNQAIKQAVSEIPKHLKRTLTHDQGKEMSKHKEFTEATGIQVYFADPASPWQRGTNENTNGLIRQYFPKGTDFRIITREQIQTAQDELNQRPRAVLDFKTPDMVFNSYIALDV
jgi:IS30 family transposase